MDYFMNFITLTVYLGLGITLLIVFFKRKNYKQDDQEIDAKNGVSLNLIRSQYFLLKPSYTEFYISDFMKEPFNIFLKLSPPMISTLTKVESHLISIKTSISDTDTINAHLSKVFTELDNKLMDLIEVSNQMIEKLNENISNKDSFHDQRSKLPTEAVREYMGAVNLLVDILNSYRVVNRETHCILADKYPELVRQYVKLSAKYTYLLFINLTTYSNRIDEELFVYK